jgi:hypothetical protein
MFYDSLNNTDLYETDQKELDAFSKNGIPFRMIIVKFNGGKYIEDIAKEARFKGCVFFVRNDDDNCLYAALFAALAYRDKKFLIGGETHTFEKREFETNRSLSNYKV